MPMHYPKILENDTASRERLCNPTPMTYGVVRILGVLEESKHTCNTPKIILTVRPCNGGADKHHHAGQ